MTKNTKKLLGLVGALAVLGGSLVDVLRDRGRANKRDGLDFGLGE